MIQNSHQSSLLEDTLASNVPLVTKADTDDDRLAQLFMVLHRTPAEEQDKFVEQVLRQWGIDSRDSKLPRVLRDNDLRDIAMFYTSMEHFRSSKAGTGLSCRQLSSWHPVTGGVSHYSYCVYENSKSNSSTDTDPSCKFHVGRSTLSVHPDQSQFCCED
jgi:hypothetical protein